MSILIYCPQCGRGLKLPDRSLLGRRAKCPKCTHSFVLQEPAASKEETRDSPTIDEPLPPPAPKPVAPPSPVAERAVFPTLTDDPAGPEPFPFFESTHKSDDLSTLIKERQRKQARSRNTGLVIAAVILAVGGGIAIYSYFITAKPQVPKPLAGTLPPAKSVELTNEDAADGIDPGGTEFAKMGSPTKGKPIELRYIPFGTQVLVNLRPAELWQEASLGEEIRLCVPPLARLVESTIRETFLCDPSVIEELLVCLIPGPRGNLPEVASVAHFASDQTGDEFVQKLGQRSETADHAVYSRGDRVYLAIDRRTFAVCPKNQLDEMIKAIDQPHPAEQIDPLSAMTDRDRHVTAIVMPLVFRLYETWFPESLRPFVNSSVDWFGAEVETVSWSGHFTPKLFYSEILLRNKEGASKKLEQNMKQRLSGLAEKLVKLIEPMNPRERGKRLLIGRVPAMVEVFSMATLFDRGPHHVRLITPLPDRGAPNLLLGTYLAWDESTRTDFSKPKPKPNEGTSVPVLVVDRLKMKIDVDFRSIPFSETFASLGSDISTPIDIDGDALKIGGFTKNLKQTFQMDAVRVQDVIIKIFEISKGLDANPEKNLVIVVDEGAKRILVTTRAAASQKGLTPFEFN